MSSYEPNRYLWTRAGENAEAAPSAFCAILLLIVHILTFCDKTMLRYAKCYVDSVWEVKGPIIFAFYLIMGFSCLLLIVHILPEICAKQVLAVREWL